MRILFNILSIFFSAIKFNILKLFYYKCFYFSLIERFSPNTSIRFISKGKIILGEKVRAHSGVKLRVINKEAILKIGNNVAINYDCMFVASKNIIIENGVEFGPHVYIYDHDHDFRANGGLKANLYTKGTVFIGENTWIGANVVILKNTYIGKNCVIAAGTILSNCKIEDNTIVYGKKEIICKSI